MKKLLYPFLFISVMTISSLGISSCGKKGSSDSDLAIPSTSVDEGAADLNNVSITFWNPITGPDSTYMQDLIRAFNTAYKGKINVVSDAQAEANHYQRILTSFTDNSTADLCLIHRSRVATFYRANKLRDMTDILTSQEINADDYVGDTYSSGVFDDKVYAMAYDVLPTVLFYNRKLIPEGYTEEMILSDDFTVELMCEMMKEAYVDAPISSKKTYGMSFNYSYTEPMFLSFLAQQGVQAVSEDNPTQPTFANAAGYAAAEAVRSIPFTTDENGKKVSSESGSDHLNIFAQGRALFTIDGIWSAPDACEKTTRVDAGVALLPKMNAEVTRNVAGDGHSFAMFTNKSMSEDKDKAIGIFMKYLIDNSGIWCQGGKVAAREDIALNEQYQSLEWGYLSNLLTNIISPVKVYTYDTITEPIGSYVAKLCEGQLTDVQGAIDAAAKEAKEAAEAL